MRRYCKSEDNVCQLGVSAYTKFLTVYGLDDTKPYDYRQLGSLEAMGLFPPVRMISIDAETPRESTSWIPQWKLDNIKQDTENKWYLVEACLPLISMNSNYYSKGELIQATRTLVGKRCNIDHYRSLVLHSEYVEIDDAQYARIECMRVPREGKDDDLFYYGVAECLIRVHRKAGEQYDLNLNNMLLSTPPEIYSVSIEARCKRGSKRVDNGYACLGLNFMGLAFLRRKFALPGIPLTVITHLKGAELGSPEKIRPESQFQGEQKEMNKSETQQPVKPPATKQESRAKLELAISEMKRLNRDQEEQIDMQTAEIKHNQDELEIKDVRIRKLELEQKQVEERHIDTNSRLEELRTTHETTDNKVGDLIAENTKLEAKNISLKNSQKLTDDTLEDIRKRVELAEDKTHLTMEDNLKLTTKLTKRNNENIALRLEVEGLKKRVAKARRIARVQLNI